MHTFMHRHDDTDQQGRAVRSPPGLRTTPPRPSIHPAAERPSSVRILGRVQSSQFFQRSQGYREHVRIWLRANGIDPTDVLCSSDVLVLALDGPTIQYESIVRDEHDETSCHGVPRTAGASRHVLMVVPLPGHLNDHHERQVHRTQLD